MATINTELVKIALDRVEGSTFERFVNDFYPSLAGGNFFPLGGVKDGGADAFGGDTLYEKGGSSGTFYQASVQEDFRAKIRHTIKRLREFGREPKMLAYVTLGLSDISIPKRIAWVKSSEWLSESEMALTSRVKLILTRTRGLRSNNTSVT
ncbi:hypothetical protein ACSNN7_15715 [Micromonospora sp. URMC 105]|uniref:hypothetical protein n=1 Tax=Micromonospora sp. URMC 105 TaxID=3423413 RepID=UPI003F1A698B